jgi:hypothetical protein
MKRKNFFLLLSPLFIFVLFFSANIFYSKLCHELLKDVTVHESNGINTVVNSFTGNITVSSWDNPDVSMKVYGNPEAKDKIEVEASELNSGVKLDCREKPSMGSGIQDELNYDLNIELFVPKNQNVSIKTGSGNLTAENINGKVKLTTGGGNINAMEISDNVYGITGGGNIKIDNSHGDINVITGGGNIVVIDFKGAVTALTEGGNIDMKGSNAAVNASTTGGNVTLDYYGSNYGVILNSESGNINLELPADFKADLNLLTEDGKISSELAKEKNKNFLMTPLNGGGKKLYCLTVTGNIILNIKKS